MSNTEQVIDEDAAAVTAGTLFSLVSRDAASALEVRIIMFVTDGVETSEVEDGLCGAVDRSDVLPLFAAVGAVSMVGSSEAALVVSCGALSDNVSDPDGKGAVVVL